jgi:hypothetical protein
MRYLVEVSLPTGWEGHGSVLLPPGASSFQVESALMGVGVYAPRGADELDWVIPFGATGQVFSALIFDATGEPIVRLIAVEKRDRRVAR